MKWQCVVFQTFAACSRQWWYPEAVSSLRLLLCWLAVSSSVLTWRGLHTSWNLIVFDKRWPWICSPRGGFASRVSHGLRTKFDDLGYRHSCDASSDYYASTNQPLLLKMYLLVTWMKRVQAKWSCPCIYRSSASRRKSLKTSVPK